MGRSENRSEIRRALIIPWLITQRPAVLHNDVLSRADTLVHEAIGADAIRTTRRRQ